MWSFKADPSISLDELAFRVETLASSLSGSCGPSPRHGPGRTRSRWTPSPLTPRRALEFEAQLVDKVSVTDFIGALIGTTHPSGCPISRSRCWRRATAPNRATRSASSDSWNSMDRRCSVRRSRGPAPESRGGRRSSLRDKALALTGDTPNRYRRSRSFALTVNRSSRIHGKRADAVRTTPSRSPGDVS